MDPNLPSPGFEMSQDIALRLNLSGRGNRAKLPPISDLMTRALGNENLISLAAGFIDNETMPIEVTQQAVAAMMADEQTAKLALQYGENQGHAPLREIILDRLRTADQKSYQDIELDQVIITPGSNQLLHLIANTLLDEQDIVMCASPTYFVFMCALEDLGAVSFGVKSDENGMVPESLDAALAKLQAEGELHRVKAIYLVSYFDNPAGMTTSPERRQQIVEIADRYSEIAGHRIFILEDAAYRELRFDNNDTNSVFSFDEQHESVIYAGTFSKSLSAGIRVGWGIFPKELADKISFLKGNLDFGAPHFSQMMVAKILEMDLYDSHVERIRQNYARKQKLMLDAADKHLQPIDGVTYHRANGGLYLWLTLPESIAAGDDGKLFDLCLERGLLYVPGEFCFPNQGEPIQKNTIRLSFGVLDGPPIEDGIKILADSIRELV